MKKLSTPPAPPSPPPLRWKCSGCGKTWKDGEDSKCACPSESSVLWVLAFIYVVIISTMLAGVIYNG